MKPVLFSLGPIHLYSYGFTIAFGVLIATWLMRRRSEQEGFCGRDTLYDLVFAAIASGFIGARAAYVIENAAWYMANPWKVLAIWEGGLIFYWGLLSASLGVALFLRSKKIPAVRGLDFMAPYAALVHAFGRLGCFLNGCCFGTHCPYPWKVSFPGGPDEVHPAQLYEAAYLFFLFWFLKRLSNKRAPQGTVFGMYLIIYGIARFAIEFVRPQALVVMSLTVNQWISFIVVAAGFLFLRFNRRNHPGADQPGTAV